MKYFFSIVLIWITCHINGQAIILEDLIKANTLESTLNGKTIGYYNGSFDPLHKGHEKIVERILAEKLCDYVIVYPAWGNDHFKNRLDLSIRQKMIFAVYEQRTNVIVTNLPPNELQTALMKASTVPGMVESKFENVNYIGIIGSDVAFEMLKPENTYRLSHFLKGEIIPDSLKNHTVGGLMAVPVNAFIIILRNSDSAQSLNSFLGDRPIISILSTPYLDVSSTRIRMALKHKESIEMFVSSSVQSIIEEFRLYGTKNSK